MRKAASFLGMATGLAVIMTTGAVEPASARSRTATESEDVTITLRIYDYVRVNRPILLAAESEATAILAQAGLEARWVDCPTTQVESNNHPDCESAWQADDFVVRVLPNTMVDSRAKWQEALGYTPECGEVGTCTGSVFYDRVTGLAEGANATLPALLGRAMAHEIGHLLLGANSHSRTGIMRAFWSARDLSLDGRPYLLFTPEQSRQMKTRLAERAQTWLAESKVAAFGHLSAAILREHRPNAPTDEAIDLYTRFSFRTAA